MKNQIRNFLIVLGFVIANHTNAQETATPVQDSGTPLTFNSTDWSSASDVQVLLQAVQSVPTVSADSVRKYGNFYSAQHAPGTRNAWPPLPGDSRGVPIWDLGNGFYLMDDYDVDYNAPLFSKELLTGTKSSQSMMVQANDLPFPSGGDSGDDSGEPNFPQWSAPTNGDLWLQITNVSNTIAFLKLSNTLADVPYEIQYKTDLLQVDWQSANWFTYGSELTNWTPYNAVAFSPTNLFFRIRSWQDDGSGLPLWWQIQNFGTNGVDPYGDPDGDGWNNLQEFQNGTDPNSFNTPPAPQGVTVTYNASSDTTTISWPPSSGSVTGYTLTLPSGNINLAANVTSYTFSGTPSYDFEGMVGPYNFQANYAGGNSPLTSAISSQQNVTSATFVHGAFGHTYVLVSGIPTNAVTVRVKFTDYSAYTNFDFLAENITNGLCQMPDEYPSGYSQGVFVQTFDANGNPSAMQIFSSYYGPWPRPYNWSQPYFDGQRQLKDNLIFQLRAAMKDFPFAYTATWWGYNPWMVFGNLNATYTYAGFYQLDEVTNQYSTYEQLGSFAPDWPFENNWRYRNFVYSDQEAQPPTDWLYYNLYGTGHTTNSVFGSLDNYYNGLNGYYDEAPTPMTLGPIQSDDSLRPYLQPKYIFPTPTGLTNGEIFFSLLSTNDTQWLASYAMDSSDTSWDEFDADGNPIGNGNLGEIGVTNYYDDDWNEYYTMQSGARNYWGLPFVSAKLAYDDGSGNLATTTLHPGDTTTQGGYWYPETAQPQFQTAEYDFWNRSDGYYDDSYNFHSFDAIPGESNFSSTNVSDNHIILAVGSTKTVVGYAKLGLQNGYSGAYAYLAQYFDKAYKIDDDGNVTTNQTGVLSSYGDFFATEPGSVALVTMPDIDTSERGTDVVYCVSLNVDKDHDGEMNLNFASEDATSQNSPFVFWINNRHIEPGTTPVLGLFGNPLDHDLQTSGNFLPDYSYGQITCKRDLEDFARLWISGMPSLSDSQGYSITLSCDDISNSPAINLYVAETNGGTLYLTDTNVAQTLVGETKLATISSANTYTFPPDFFTNAENKCFIFEGAHVGTGKFTLTIYKNDNIVAQTSVYIDLHDIKDLYEQAHVTNLTQDWPQIVDDPRTSGFAVDRYVPSELVGDEKRIITFVHGWRITQWAYYDFSETMFRRLYWQGFNGRFAALRWPCFSSDSFGTNADETTADIASFLTFNRSEHMGLESGAGAAAYFNDLKQRFTNYTVNVCSHSQGADVVAAALTQLAVANQKPIQNYVIMQGAFTAQSYDSGVPNYPLYMTMEGVIPTPNTYLSYAQSITNAVQGTIVNFFNTNDFALKLWNANQSFFEIVTNAGVVGYLALKPDTFLGYQTDGTSAWLTNNLPDQLLSTTPRSVSDPLELMPFVSRPHSLAVGELSGVHGAVDDELDLISEFGFTGEWYDHSGEFNRSIQEPEGNQFYFSLLRAIRTGHP